MTDIAISRCATCAFWLGTGEKWDQIERPVDPDTYETMVTSFAVKACRHPELLFCERPLDPAGFAVADGSTYMANLYTGPDFGCVRHEPVT